MRNSISSKRKSISRFWGVSFGVLLILVSSIDALPRRGPTPSDTHALEKLSDSFESIAAKVSPAVVRILTSGYGHDGSNDYQMDNILQRWHSGGSGVILDSSGYIITNAHVIENALTIRVAVAAQI
ncbi:MAG: hypothetical protein IIB00_04620, partial [candidate division Zixibacteria bacterium]|nr:hypothetical protein [candidate division Zixibacteria bacterium]